MSEAVHQSTVAKKMLRAAPLPEKSDAALATRRVMMLLTRRGTTAVTESICADDHSSPDSQIFDDFVSSQSMFVLTREKSIDIGTTFCRAEPASSVTRALVTPFIGAAAFF
jgi:hypothetical protein